MGVKNEFSLTIEKLSSRWSGDWLGSSFDLNFLSIDFCIEVSAIKQCYKRSMLRLLTTIVVAATATAAAAAY